MLPRLTRNCLYVLLLNILLVKYLVNGTKKITILHMNDMHSRFEETSPEYGKCSLFSEKFGHCFGGFARLSSALKMQKKKAEAEGRSVLILNAGDIFQGTLYYNFFKAEIVSIMTSMLHLDATCLGNHEFDDGPSVLAQFINNSSFPFVASNINVSGEPDLDNAKNLKKSVTLDVGGLKIGIVGYITPVTKMISSPRNVTFSPEIPSIRAEVNELRKNGCQVVIGLGHSGFNMDKQIAKEVDGLDLVVGGHTNTFLYNGEPPSFEIPEGPYPFLVNGPKKKVPVVQACAYTKYLGVLNIDFKDDGSAIERMYGNPVLLNNLISEDPEVVEVLKPWKLKVDERSKEKVGITRVFLDGGHNTKKRESNLANLITDAYVEYYMMKNWNVWENISYKGWTDSPIAIIQGGGIRSSINASSAGGVITYYDVVSVLPFMEMLSRVDMRGKTLREAFEWSVAMYEMGGGNLEGAFLQASGLKVEYDLSKSIGERVVSLKARCGKCIIPRHEEVKDGEMYSVLMSNYLSRGGDGFSMFLRETTIHNLNEIDTQIVYEYIKRKSPVYPGVEDRIILRASATTLVATSLFYLSIRTVLLYTVF